jgi:hypothetical protein
MQICRATDADFEMKRLTEQLKRAKLEASQVSINNQNPFEEKYPIGYKSDRTLMITNLI